MGYDVSSEYRNITNYSPFAHLNEMSPQFRDSPFHLPFVERFGEIRPVHPDTFNDLQIPTGEIVAARLVHPTSSFRTVYYPAENVCYKLPLRRRITRLFRGLSHHTMKVSERVSELFSRLPCENFSFLPESCHYADDPDFNYIVRDMGQNKIFPWFSVIKGGNHPANFMLSAIRNILHAWAFYASHDMFLEMHTQNVLVDPQARVYYRDLSDVPGFDDPLRRPPWTESWMNRGDVAACTFDRAVCRQNLDHVFRHSKHLTEDHKNEIKTFLASKMKEFDLRLPPYSMDFSQDTPEHLPVRRELTWWRAQKRLVLHTNHNPSGR